MKAQRTSDSLEEMDEEDLRNDRLADEVERTMGEVAHLRPSKRVIRSRRGGPSHQFSIRFAPDEIDALQAAADTRSVTITEFIRSTVMKAVAESGSENAGIDAELAGVDELIEALQARVDAARRLPRRRPARARAAAR
jgi:uncharacterized protein (DUF1778 family)